MIIFKLNNILNAYYKYITKKTKWSAVQPSSQGVEWIGKSFNCSIRTDSLIECDSPVLQIRDRVVLESCLLIIASAC